MCVFLSTIFGGGSTYDLTQNYCANLNNTLVCFLTIFKNIISVKKSVSYLTKFCFMILYLQYTPD